MERTESDIYLLLGMYENGIKYMVRKSSKYISMTVGDRTWYWNIDTGEFDGTSSGGKDG